MKLAAAMTGIALLAATAATAAGTRSYQVTGPLLEVRDDAVVVQKGKEKWEIAKDKETKISGDLKVGSKATVMYTMKAASIETKAETKKDTKRR